VPKPMCLPQSCRDRLRGRLDKLGVTWFEPSTAHFQSPGYARTAWMRGSGVSVMSEVLAACVPRCVPRIIGFMLRGISRGVKWKKKTGFNSRLHHLGSPT
jgi:hypothetical protein